MKSMWILLILAMVLSSVGCRQNSAPGNKLSTPFAGGPQPAQGTVDGGGGAGFKGKPLESYRRNIEEFPEFKLVDKVLESIARVNPKHEKIFRHIVRDRMWLLLDEPVPKISASRQGVPYNIDQWAVQNSKEIWMSDQYTGSDSDKAKILLHEILVGLKIMRFLSYNDYCYQWTSDRKLCESSGNEVLIPDYKLTDLDHADVRNMGEWLWANHANMTEDTFGHEMHTKQFQGPHYSWKPAGPLAQEVRILNPVIDRLNERTHELFTDWGADSVAKQKCVIHFKPHFEKNRMHVKVKVRDLKTNELVRTINYDLEYNRQTELRTNLRATLNGRAVNWRASDGREMKNLGDKSTKMSFELVNESVVELYAGDSQVVDVTDGKTSSSGDNTGPNGISCDASPIQLPIQYDLWLEMRDSDRELLERKRYNGKTVKELSAELSELPGFKNTP